MTYAISSAEPSELFTYKVKGRALDAALVVHSNVLRATLQYFEITCREPGFQMKVSHSADWMASYAHDSERVDDRVGEVGGRFLMADTAVSLGHVAIWAVVQVLAARNWVEDRADELVHISVMLRDEAEGVFAEAASHIVAISRLVIDKLPPVVFVRDVTIAFPTVAWLATALLADADVRRLALRLIVPRQQFEPLVIEGISTPVNAPRLSSEAECKNPYVLPTTAAELFKRIEEVPDDEPIQIVNLGGNQYMILIKGTRDWYGHSNTWEANLYSGLGYESVYSQRVKALIEQYIPQGTHPPATLYIAGHSQGGHVAQIVANEYAANGKYAVGAMFSFGAYLLTQPHPGIQNAHAFLYANDPLNLIDSVYDQTPGGETILVDGTQLNPLDAHGDYENSETLQDFQITCGPGTDLTPDYESFSAPQEPPITGAVTSAVRWSNDTIQESIVTINDLSSETANTVSGDLKYISNEIVTGVREVDDTLQNAGETVTSTVVNWGAL
jgi:hypothetical protein